MEYNLPTPKWNQKFRRRVISLVLDEIWYVENSEIIKPEYFETSEESIIVELIIAFYKIYNRAPDLDELLILVEDYEDAGNVLRADLKNDIIKLATHIYDNMDSWDLDFVEQTVVDFAKQQAYKLAVLDSALYVEEGKLDKIEQRFKEAQKVGVETKLRSTYFLKEDAADWSTHIVEERKIPTGIYHLDVLLEGGISRGECGVVIGPTNRGKTQALVNFAFGAAGWITKSNVSIVTLELSREKYAKRLAARTTFNWLKRDMDSAEYAHKFGIDANRRLPGEISITKYPAKSCGVYEINELLVWLKIQGFETDLLIIDYADLMKMPSGFQSKYDAQGENYLDIIQLLGEHNIGGWTASQTGRGSGIKVTVDTDDIAESIKKANNADIVLTWSQTKDEKERNIMRFYGAKFRDGVPGFYVKCKVNDNAHSIVSTEIMERKSLKEHIKSMREDED